MSGLARSIEPAYVRLSGEIADQAILDALQATYPQARVGHAFASTEAGVAFEVNDGREGFPDTVVGTDGDVQIRVVDGALQVRSGRTAVRYLGASAPLLADEEGFVDTGDMVDHRNGRYYFLGRRTGLINVGGLKVYPEEIEGVINRHPSVRASRVRAKRNPILGALVTADVVLKIDVAGDAHQLAEQKQDILQVCREHLATHKVPATIRFVPALEVGAAGKLARRTNE
jgi:acyl-CoA synthetase (AMP-forming)/AMP-acid ligase II